MEQLVVAPEYYKDVLYAIYKQGKDNTFSDVTLKCGDAVFHGHKCILSTQSEYFNAFFQGNFCDSNAAEIDLSSVFEDEQSFEQVMSFFYTGVFDFSDIFLIARYASFFQIESLKELCKAKMNQLANLENCITYYTFARSADYEWLEEDTRIVLERRFHDYFIHDENSLRLCASDLHDLLGWDCLTHSSACDILEFIAKWVLIDITIERINVGQEVLDFLKEREQNPEERILGPVKPCVESYRQLETKLNTSIEKNEESNRSFLLTFQSIMEKLPMSDNTTSTEETVLFTLSKRKKVDLPLFAASDREETPIEHFATGKHENWKTVYDVCMYRPSTKLWYNIDTIEDKPCYNNDEDILPKSARLLPFEKQSCKLNFIHGKLLFSSRLSDKILIYNCQEKGWNSLKADTKVEPTERDEFWFLSRRKRDLSTIGNHVFVWNENVFVIKVKVNSGYDNDLHTWYSDDESDDDLYNVSGVYFEIHKMDEISGCLTLILKSPVQPYICERYFSDMKRHEGLRSFVIAKASKSMDEIMVVCLLNDDTVDGYVALTKGCISFVANMEDKAMHFFPPDTCEQFLYQPKELFIVDDTDGFLIAISYDNLVEACKVIGSYQYKSQEIKLVEGLSHPHARIRSYSSYRIYIETADMPMVSGNDSLWFFYGMCLYDNDFQNVKFHKAEGETYETIPTEHPPHPFTTLVAAVETKVNADIFRNLKPTCFLG